MVVVDDVVEQPVVVGIESQWRRQLWRRLRCHHIDGASLEQLDGVTKRDPLGLHDPGHDVTTGGAAEAVPQVLGRCDDQRWRAVVVKRTAANKVLAARHQLHTAADEVGDRQRLEAGEFVRGDAGHGLLRGETLGAIDKLSCVW